MKTRKQISMLLNNTEFHNGYAINNNVKYNSCNHCNHFYNTDIQYQSSLELRLYTGNSVSSESNLKRAMS